MADRPMFVMPAAGHDMPPPSSARDPLSTSEPYETRGVTVAMASRIEQAVYSTKRRWRGIDVLAHPPPVVGDGAVNFFCYAVAAGQRALVQTGRFAGTDYTAGFGAKRVISVRDVECDRFDVTYSADSPQAVLSGHAMQVGVVASDQCLPVETPAGVSSFDSSGGQDALQDLSAAIIVAPAINVNLSGPAYEALAVDAVCTAALALARSRWVQLFDYDATMAGTIPPGTVPVWSAPLGENLSSWDLQKILKGRFFRTGGLAIQASSTPGVLTAVAAGGTFGLLWYR